MNTILVLNLIVNSACISDTNFQDDFPIFSERFVQSSLPLLIDEVFTRKVRIDNVVHIDTAYVNKYIERNRKIGRSNLYDFYKYYPLISLQYDEFVSLIILKRGGAGAVEDRIMMKTFDYYGNHVSDLQIAHQFGDCSMLRVMKAELREDLSIILRKEIIQLDCTTEEILSTEEETVKYKLNLTGFIIEE